MLQPGRHLRLHPQRGDICGKALQVSSEARLGDREIVRDESSRGLQQPRIVRRGLDVAGTREICASQIAGGIELIGEQTPAIGEVGLERNGAAQRRDRLGAASGLPERRSKLQVYRRRPRLFPRQGFEHLERRLQLTGEALRCAEDEARAWLARERPQNLTGLFRGQRRALLEQSPGVRERKINRSDRFDCAPPAHAAECTTRSRGGRAAGSAQGRGARRGTIHTQPMRPRTLTAAATTNAPVKCWLRSTRSPVRAGAITPAKLPQQFWIPTHRAEAVGPARICDIANAPGDEIPVRT